VKVANSNGPNPDKLKKEFALPQLADNRQTVTADFKLWLWWWRFRHSLYQIGSTLALQSDGEEGPIRGLARNCCRDR
jgi:hypothetical protein